MSRIQSKEQLLKEISCLVDEYVSFCVHSKNQQQYNMVVKEDEDTSASPASGGSADVELQEQTPAPVDTQCKAILSSKKRCKRDVSDEEGNDPELCKYHNNPRFKGKINKIDPPTPAEPVPEASPAEAEDDESDPEDLVTVYLSKDEDDDMVDQDGNIWDVNERIIVGKKDLKTNEKVFFKNI
jgi:hypothetical protein